MPSVSSHTEREKSSRVLDVCVFLCCVTNEKVTKSLRCLHGLEGWAGPYMGCPIGPYTRMRPKRPCASDVYVVRFGYIVLCDSSY